jgi:hypothetical protein
MALVSTLVFFSAGAKAQVGMIEAEGKQWTVRKDIGEYVSTFTTDNVRGVLLELGRDKQEGLHIQVFNAVHQYDFIIRKDGVAHMIYAIN